MAPDSTTGLQPRKRRKSTTPPKPFKDFPLTPHPGGYWCRKIAGKLHYFGRWGRMVNGKMVRYEGEEWDAGWKSANALYDDQPADFKTGRIKTITKPQAANNSTNGDDDDVIDVAYICSEFRISKQRKLSTGELGQRMFDEYETITDILVEQFGGKTLPQNLGASDFEALRYYLAKRYKSARLTNSIVRVRSVFRYAYDAELIDKPIRCLQSRKGVFSVPSASVVRKERNSKPKHELTPEECRTLLKAAPVQLKAMIYLGLNCGYGAHDCATLPLSAVDLKGSMIDYERPKTGISRRCSLWPETVESLRVAIADRISPKTEDANGLVFITTRGRAWLSGGIANPICQAVRSLMRTTGVHRPGFGPYTLRRIFRTIADGVKDQPAIDYVMGHVDPTMGSVYRQSIDDKRLVAVSNFVRNWLLAGSSPKGGVKKLR